MKVFKMGKNGVMLTIEAENLTQAVKIFQANIEKAIRSCKIKLI